MACQISFFGKKKSMFELQHMNVKKKQLKQQNLVKNIF